MTVFVKVFPKGRPNKVVKVYAIQDDQSKYTIVTSTLFDALDVANVRYVYIVLMFWKGSIDSETSE